MAIIKVPYQGLSAWIPDEGIPYYSDWTKRNVHIRQGKTIYTLPSSQFQGEVKETAPDNQEGLQWLSATYQQGNPELFKNIKPRVGEILTKTISAVNPHGVDITSSFDGVIEKSPSIQENLARAGATPEQISSLSASAAKNAGGAYTPEQLKTAGVVAPSPAKDDVLSSVSKSLTEIQNRISTEGITDSSGKTLLAPKKPVPVSPLVPSGGSEGLKQNPNFNQNLPESATNQRFIFSNPNTVINPITGQTASSAAGSTNFTTQVSALDEQINTAAQKEAEALSGTKIDLRDSSALISKLISSVEEKPQTPSLAETFASKRASLGLDILETQLSDADTQIAKLEADYQATEAEEGGRLVSMGQIRKRQSALGIEYTKKRGELQTQRTNIANQLNMKYGVLNSLMTFTGQDYQNANQAYQQKFNNAITMTNLIKGIEEDQKNDQEKAKDNARANVDIMYDLIKNGTVNYDSLPETTKMDIKNMELQSGLPVGFVSALKKVSAGKEILFHRATPDETGEIVYYKDGTSQVITFPGVKPKPSTDKVDKTVLQKQMAAVLETRKKNGKVSPEDWNKLRSAWISEGGVAKDFDSTFSQYIDKNKESEYYVEKAGSATIVFP